MKHQTYLVVLVLLLVALVAGACGGGATPAPAASSDLLGEVMQRGILRVSTDPAYPPQSELVEDVQPPSDTKCKGEERAANQFQGFDIDVAAELAKRMGVEVCFVTPDWTLITGGSWSGRWDLSIGSMTITPERMEKLYFTQPYYTTPAAFFVHQENSSYSQPADVSGKKVGVCAGCTYEAYLDGSLAIPGETIDFVVEDAEIMGYDTDTPALQDLALGDGVRLDAVLTALPTGQGVINDGLPLKQLGDPVYFEYLAGAIDKAAPKDATTFRAKVTEILQAMHQDGTLKQLAEKYYGVDLAEAAGKFDIAGLKQ